MMYDPILQVNGRHVSGMEDRMGIVFCAKRALKKCQGTVKRYDYVIYRVLVVFVLMGGLSGLIIRDAYRMKKQQETKNAGHDKRAV